MEDRYKLERWLRNFLKLKITMVFAWAFKIKSLTNKYKSKMSLDRTIHLEPFIKIPVQYEHYEKEIKTCGEHENHKGDEFCPKCGKSITTQKIPAKSTLWNEELIGSENLYHYVEDETMYLFSNTKSETDIDTDENVFTTLTPELISTMIAEFTEKHKEDIELLEAKIKAKVKVEFGFVYDVH